MFALRCIAFAGPTEVEVPTPLGARMHGGPDSGYFITKIMPGGNAEATGKINAGQRIVSVNKKTVDGLTKEAVKKIFTESAGAVLL